MEHIEDSHHKEGCHAHGHDHNHGRLPIILYFIGLVLAVFALFLNDDYQTVKNMLFGGEGLFDTVITGPGRVHLQTMTIGKLARLMIPFLPLKKK